MIFIYASKMLESQEKRNESICIISAIEKFNFRECYTSVAISLDVNTVCVHS